ncbi:DUF4013 domain-containing protein [Halalkalicoccus subterraneus]|uniref:DUF4013 domain-containing protein n=1 Tax=Halalkalicoccus subterraneus TaxID=2675002 RepID=UPI000EFD86CB|nr:DUF4013 domain-containing protein [Halalkalicoccus subterraneus]
MISESIRYLSESDDAVTTVLLGGIMTLFAFLIVPLFAVAGYMVRVLDRTAKGESEPPIFDEWGALIVDGAKASAIAFVYALVPTAVLVVFLVSGGLLGASGSDLLGAIGGLTALIGAFVWLAATLMVAYAVPAAIANFAETRRVGAGFEWSTMRRVLVDRTYATGWLTAFAILVGGGVVSTLLNVVPLLGFVASAFVGFYAAVAAYYVIGRTWGEMNHAPLAERPAIRGQAEI